MYIFVESLNWKTTYENWCLNMKLYLKSKGYVDDFEYSGYTTWVYMFILRPTVCSVCVDRSYNSCKRIIAPADNYGKMNSFKKKHLRCVMFKPKYMVLR